MDRLNENEIINMIRKPTSDIMIRDWIKIYRPNLNVNIVSYNEIERFNSLDQLLKSDQACIILYSVGRSTCGHWCLINRPNERELEFFDSYANYLDGAITDKRDRFSDDHPYLSDLVKRDDKIKKILFNNLKLQTLDKDSNVCGRYCALRYACKDIKLDRFLKSLKNAKIKPYDLLISLLTYDL